MIRVFVGCASGDDLESQVVLEYSLRKHASKPVKIVWMQLSPRPGSPFYGWQTQGWSTPFSGFRWAVPEVCGFEGKAIYTDSDVIFRADIAELWEQKFQPGKCVLAKGGQDSWRFCVSLWDCAAAKPHMMPPAELRTRADAHQMMIQRFRYAPFVRPFTGNWNCIDGEDYTDLANPDIKLIHYSQESAQPHLKYAVPRLAREGRKHWYEAPTRQHWRGDLIELFDKTLAEAIAAGFAPENYQPAEPFGPYRIASHMNQQPHRWAK